MKCWKKFRAGKCILWMKKSVIGFLNPKIREIQGRMVHRGLLNTDKKTMSGWGNLQPEEYQELGGCWRGSSPSALPQPGWMVLLSRPGHFISSSAPNEDLRQEVHTFTYDTTLFAQITWDLKFSKYCSVAIIQESLF